MKKLLILGGKPVGTIDIIEYAKSIGIHTIVADYLPKEESNGKRLADECWDISTADVDQIVTRAKTVGIDAVFTGVHEFNITQTLTVCEKLGLPFYATREQWNIVTDKYLFQQYCKKSGITVAKAFDIKRSDQIVFPVIVKPVDSSGGRGITVCRNHEELSEAYQLALNFSSKKEVLIEEYIVADEIMVYFLVHDGEIELSAMCDRYMHHFGTSITQLPVGYYYPSKYLSVLKEYNLEKFIKLIKLLGIHNGLIAFQAFVINNDIIPFDPTYRLDGTMHYNFTDNINGINEMKLMVNYSLTKSMGDFREIKRKETPNFKKIAFQLPILLRNGTIKSIQGLEEVNNLDEVIHIHTLKRIGDVMTKSADFTQIFCRIFIVSESVDEIKKTVQRVFEALQVLDENGNDMIICKIDTDRIGR